MEMEICRLVTHENYRRCMRPWIAFTITALAYMTALVVSYVVMFKQEDRFNLAKWGEEYQKYMGSVTAINFIKG
jgi:protein-S-isoprenylcysteine O-methyltransferase Ste14